MTLNLSYSRLPRLSYYHPPLSILSESLILNNNSNNASFLRNLALNFSRNLRPNASLSESESSGRLADSSVSELFDDEFVSHISVAKDAHQALHMIAERSGQNGGFVSASDGCRIILAALERNNPELALSAFYEMRASFEQEVTETGPFVERWKWSRPDIRVYTTLVQGLAASLRVSDALRIINNICQVGVSPAEEVPFGKVVRCPTCMIAVAVAQPQYGIQIVSCCKCRYQYELVSGNIINIESEEIRISSCRTQLGYSSMDKRTKIPANKESKHSFCCSLHSGPNPFWHGSDTPLCN